MPRTKATAAQVQWQRHVDVGQVVLTATAIALTACAALLLDVYLGRTDPVHLVMLRAFGPLAFLVPLGLGLLVFEFYRRHEGHRRWLRFEESCGALLLFVVALTASSFSGFASSLVGDSLSDELVGVVGQAGSILSLLVLAGVGVVLAFHVTWSQLSAAGQPIVWLARAMARGIGSSARYLIQRRRVRAGATHKPRPPRKLQWGQDDGQIDLLKPSLPQPLAVPDPIPLRPRTKRKDVAPPMELPPDDEPPVPDFRSIGTDDAAEEPAPDPPLPLVPSWPAPSLDLLDPVPPAISGPTNNDARAHIIEETLASFNVSAQVVEVQSGPTVTQFGLRPAAGVRVQRITALANDLALALAAPSIRIEAPVPGKPVVGIEIPNGTTALVTLREILESDAYARMKSPLKIALGKNVSGEPVVVDLARMPHLLIAGATGSGKSVCLNSLIACLLFHNSPERLRLLMIDPKMVELTTFNGVPHLLHPVVTEMDKVSGTLKWVIKEMHRRYKLFGEAGARNIARYNEMLYERLQAGEPQTEKNKPLPYIVFIIDELADLMMVSPAEVEDNISRLAALARATGIHLVLATQRPSVDVITGVIKANFPARIAFAVSSQVDSRTILDHAGAEKLMGRGDMLYLPSDGTKVIRIQGAFLSERENEALVKYWQTNAPSTPEQIKTADLETPKSESGEGENEDKLLSEATKVVREYRRASVSLLQRRLSIGYSRAARLLDQLEERGVVGAAEDGRSRIVLEWDENADVVPVPAGDEDDEA